MIRFLEPADAAEVAALDAALFAENAWSAEAWQAEASSPANDRRYLVDTHDGALVGYAGIMRAGSDADVLTMAVAPSHQRRGLGRALLDALLQIAEQWRCVAVFLEVEEDNQPARELYRGAGFVDIGIRRHYYGTQRHAVTMRKQLREPLGAMPLGGPQ